MQNIVLSNGQYIIDGDSYTEEQLVANFGETIANVIKKQAKHEVSLVEFTAKTEYSRPINKAKAQLAILQARLADNNLDDSLPSVPTWSELTANDKQVWLEKAEKRVAMGQGQKNILSK